MPKTAVVRKRRPDRVPLKVVKLPQPMWLKASQLASATGETLGELFARLCEKSLDREHAAKVRGKETP